MQQWVRPSGTVIPLLVIVAAGLAGCAGGATIDSTDDVTIVVTLRQPDGQPIMENHTGQPFADRTLTFRPGSGESGLGFAFERAVLRHDLGDQVEGRFNLGDFAGQVAVGRVFGPNPTTATEPRLLFEAKYKVEAQKGLTFDAPPYYTGVVDAVNETSVTFHITPEDGQRNDASAVGAVVITYTDGDTFTQVLEPLPNATFLVHPRSGAPLGLEPASYKALGFNDTHLMLARHPSLLIDWIGREVQVEARIESVVTEGDREAQVGRYDPDTEESPESFLTRPRD